VREQANEQETSDDHDGHAGKGDDPVGLSRLRGVPIAGFHEWLSVPGEGMAGCRIGRHVLFRYRSCVMAARTTSCEVPALLYRVDEAATALRLSRTAIYELIRSSRLRSVKCGRRRLIPVAAVKDYLASLEAA
jgi:excisionase family DNA binding protein